ncbi:hypothetical protein IJD44_07835 [bacterium]|nr:hypothetical protein [bacterium]
MKNQYTKQENRIIKKTELKFEKFLNSYDFLIEKLNDIQETKGIAEQLNKDTTIGFSTSKPSGSKIEKTIAEAQEISETYKDEITTILNNKIKYTKIATTMDFPYGEIIFYKYIKNYTWEKVGEKIGYERESVNKKKKEALLRFYKASSEFYKNNHIKSQKITK